MKTLEQQWMTVPEVMEFLGVTDRQVHRAAAKGLLERRRERGPHDRHPTTLFNRASVEAYKARKPIQVPVVSGDTDLTTTAVTRPGQLAAIQQITAAIAAAAELRHPAEPPAWMSAKQAAQYTSLPRLFLARLMATGVLPVLNIGSSDRPRLRIARIVLDENLPALSRSWS